MPYQHAENHAPERRARRGGGVGHQQVQPEEHRRRNLAVDEIGHAGDGAVERAQAEERHRRRRGHVGGREVEHHDQPDEEQHQVDAWPEGEGGVDLLRPRHRRRAGDDEHEREEGQGECRRVEDVAAPAVAFPLDEGLAEEADGDEQELEGEPVVLEPQEQVGAEHDRNRPEADAEGPLARPRQQGVERVGEEHLREQQRQVGVDRRPVVAPVGVDAQVAAHLDVVLRPRRRADEPGHRAP